MSLPPCGLYRTTEPIGPVEAGRLVYFHNHGDPGPGIYPPQSWRTNRAVFSKKGIVLENPEQANTLEPLLAEGFYLVLEEFTCCENNCRTFEKDMLVQLGYNGAASPLLFVPQWTPNGLQLPKQGQQMDNTRLEKIKAVKVEIAQPNDSPDPVLQ